MATFQDYLRPFLEPLSERVDEIEKRLARIEGALVKILPPGLPEEEITKPTLEERTFDAKTGPYIYRPLDNALNEIRILAVHRSLSDDDPITCELLHASLNGDASNTDTV